MCEYIPLTVIAKHRDAKAHPNILRGTSHLSFSKLTTFTPLLLPRTYLILIHLITRRNSDASERVTFVVTGARAAQHRHIFDSLPLPDLNNNMVNERPQQFGGSSRYGSAQRPGPARPQATGSTMSGSPSASRASKMGLGLGKGAGGLGKGKSIGKGGLKRHM